MDKKLVYGWLTVLTLMWLYYDMVGISNLSAANRADYHAFKKEMASSVIQYRKDLRAQVDEFIQDELRKGWRINE